MGVRVAKIQEQIKEEVSSIILRDLKDPRIGFITVTKVDVSSDLRNAKIYVSIFGSKEQFKDTWEGLQHCAGYIRRELAGRMTVRYVPEISFSLDTTMQYSAHIQELINEIHHNEKDTGNGNNNQ